MRASKGLDISVAVDAVKTARHPWENGNQHVLPKSKRDQQDGLVDFSERMIEPVAERRALVALTCNVAIAASRYM
jgi:hypothetical protein